MRIKPPLLAIFVLLLAFILPIIPVSADYGDDVNSVSSSGGGGGGVISTDEPYENIRTFDRKFKDILVDNQTIYPFNVSNISIYQVIVAGKNNEFDVPLRIESLKNTSELVSESPPGIIYSNENIWIGTRRINNATIKFKIENSWIEENKLKDKDINLFRWEEEKWNMLNINIINKDDLFTYFESGIGINNAHILAISGMKSEELKNFENINNTKSNKSSNKSSNKIEKIRIIPKPKESPGFEIILTLITMVIISIWKK